MSLLPPFKYTGSKMRSAGMILSYYPAEIDTLIEPFCGSASVSFIAMQRDLKVGQYIWSDINPIVCDMLQMIRDMPDTLLANYTSNWLVFNAETTIEHRKRVYNEIRARFNQSKSAADMYFLTRTSINGLVRFNKAGEFNASCHWSRPGMQPDKVKVRLDLASALMRNNNVQIQCQSYESYKPSDGCFFLDPPYNKGKEVYVSGFDSSSFYAWANDLERFLLTIDDGCDYPFGADVNEVLYVSGSSSFTRALQSNHKVICEKIYHKGLALP